MIWRNKSLAWLAALSVLFAALMPSLAQAFASLPAPATIEALEPAQPICHSLDAVQAAGDGTAALPAFSHHAPSDPQAPFALHLQHCPLCLTHAQVLALLPPLLVLAFQQERAEPPRFAVADDSPSPPVSWVRPQLRGPPLS